MISLPNSIAAWGEATFSKVLAAELEENGAQGLPLAGATDGGHVADAPITVLVLRFTDEGATVSLEITVLFEELEPAYCEAMEERRHTRLCRLGGMLDKDTGRVEFVLRPPA